MNVVFRPTLHAFDCLSGTVLALTPTVAPSGLFGAFGWHERSGNRRHERSGTNTGPCSHLVGRSLRGLWSTPTGPLVDIPCLICRQLKLALSVNPYGVFYIAFTISSGNSICISISFAPLILEYPSFSLYVNLISFPVTNASIFRLAIRICFDL